MSFTVDSLFNISANYTFERAFGPGSGGTNGVFDYHGHHVNTTDAVNQLSVFNERGKIESGLFKIVLDVDRLDGVHLWGKGRTKLGGGGDPFWGYHFCSETLREAIEGDIPSIFFFNQCRTTVSGGDNVN